MYEVDLSDTLLGLIIGALAMHFSHQAISKVFMAMTSPLGRVSRHGTGQNDVPVAKSVFWLFAAYFSVGCLFGFTGGTVGGFLWRPHLIRAAIGWGFAAGVLVAAFARIQAVYTNVSLASSLATLAAVTVGVLAYVGVVRPSTFTQISDDYLKAHFFEFPQYALVATLAVMGCVEAVIVWREKRVPQSAREVPLSLLRERNEGHHHVEQIFSPRNVVPFTNVKLREAILSRGPLSICWMTHTAPPSHVATIIEASIEWVGKRSTEKGDAREMARRLVAANTRVIVPTSKIAGQIREAVNECFPGSDQEWIPRIRVCDNQYRRRLLTVNGRCALTHLPVPYTGRCEEESNSCWWTESPEEVYEIEHLFDAIWEGTYFEQSQATLAQIASENGGDCIWVLAVLHDSSYLGLQLGVLHRKLATHGVNLSYDALVKHLQGLHDLGLAHLDLATQTAFLDRKALACRRLDSVKRVIGFRAPCPGDYGCGAVP